MTGCFTGKESGALRFPFFFLAVVAALFSSCGKPAEDSRAVASVNTRVLTMEMIRSQTDSSRQLTDAELRQFVNRWVTSELLYQEAQRKGYDGLAEIQQKVAEAKKQLVIAELLEKDVYTLAESSIRPDETASYYQSHAGEFALKENLVLLSIAIFSQNESAVQFRAAALGEAGWNAAVNEYRADSAKGMISLSDSLFFSQSSLYPPELWKVASVLGAQEVSFPVNTSAGYVVMRSLGQYKKGMLAPYAYVEPEIRSRLAMERRQQKYQEYIQTLRAKHEIQFMLPATDSLKLEGE